MAHAELGAVPARVGTKNINKMNGLDRKFCIAPMMEWTDRHCRFFHRLLTRRALIYTEMITTGAVLHGARARAARGAAPRRPPPPARPPAPRRAGLPPLGPADL